MFNLVDIMRQAQGGSGLDNLARQYGLSAEQAQRAVEALLPAFTMGLQRRATNPATFPDLMALIASQQFAPFFDGPGIALGPQALSQGHDLLGRLFGTPDASRRIAEQAALWSGVGVQAMQQMMPAVAAMLAGGLSRSAATQGVEGVFERFATMFGGAAPAPPPPATPFDAWAEMMRSMTPTSPAPEEQPLPNPWQAFLDGMANADKPKPPPEPAPAPVNPFEAMSGLFETGREVQQQHLTSLQNILDTFTGAGPDRR